MAASASATSNIQCSQVARHGTFVWHRHYIAYHTSNRRKKIEGRRKLYEVKKMEAGDALRQPQEIRRTHGSHSSEAEPKNSKPLRTCAVSLHGSLADIFRCFSMTAGQIAKPFPHFLFNNGARPLVWLLPCLCNWRVSISKWISTAATAPFISGGSYFRFSDAFSRRNGPGRGSNADASRQRESQRVRT